MFSRGRTGADNRENGEFVIWRRNNGKSVERSHRSRWCVRDPNRFALTGLRPPGRGAFFYSSGDEHPNGTANPDR